MYELAIESLNKKYKKKYALKNCSFKIKSGEIVGVIGKNGAGKTTLFNLIAGNTIASSGKIFFNKEELKLNASIRKDFGILIKPALYEYMNGYKFLKSLDSLNTKTHSKQEIIDILNIVGLNKAKEQLIKSYSFGMKQRLCFANALLAANKLLMLDEPFVGLDINGREIVKNHIKDISKNKGVPVIFSDHNLNEVIDLCTRVILLNNGKIVYDGNLNTLKQDIIITVETTKNLNNNLYSVLNNHQIVINESNLDESLRMILRHTKIQNIENINILNKLLNSGDENA